MNTQDLEILAKRPSLREAVQNRLEEGILRGELKDGQQLVETEIAHWLGVSRGLVREAFRELEKTGMVTHNPYRGTFVKALTPKRVRELYTLRKKLEEYAIELAIPNLTDDDITDLEAHLDQMKQVAREGNPTRLIEMDLQFHHKLYALSDHGMLIEILQGLSRQTHLFITLTKVVYALYPTLDEVAESHRPLLEAIRRKDIAAASQEIQIHINVVDRRIFEILQNNGNSDKQPL